MIKKKTIFKDEEEKIKTGKTNSGMKNLDQSLPLFASSATVVAYVQSYPTIWVITKKYFANSIDTRKY